MFSRLSFVVFCISALFVSVIASAGAELKLPAPTGPVSDFAELIDTTGEEKLVRRLERYRYMSGHDVVVVTLDTTVGRDYADRLFSFWAGRRPDLKEGLMLLVGGEGEVFLRTGPGLLPKLSQADADRLSASIDIGSGKSRVVERAVVKRVDDAIDSLVEKPAAGSRPSPLLIQTIAAFFFASMLVLPWISAMLARASTAYGGFYAGLLMAFIITLFAGPAMGALILATASPVGYLLDRAIKKHYLSRRSTGANPSWWAGGTRF